MPSVGSMVRMAREAANRPTLRGERGARDLENRYLEGLGEEYGKGRESEDEYWKRISSFDPTEAIGKYAEGAWSDISQQMDLQLRDLEGQSVGAGRLDTGFYDEDIGEVAKEGRRAMAAGISRASISGAQMNLQQLQQMGTFAMSTRNRYFDLLSGGMDWNTSMANLDRQKKADKWKAVGDVVGGVTGAIPFL